MKILKLNFILIAGLFTSNALGQTAMSFDELDQQFEKETLTAEDSANFQNGAFNLVTDWLDISFSYNQAENPEAKVLILKTAKASVHPNCLFTSGDSTIDVADALVLTGQHEELITAKKHAYSKLDSESHFISHIWEDTIQFTFDLVRVPKKFGSETTYVWELAITEIRFLK